MFAYKYKRVPILIQYENRIFVLIFFSLMDDDLQRFFGDNSHIGEYS